LRIKEQETRLILHEHDGDDDDDDDNNNDDDDESQTVLMPYTKKYVEIKV